MESSLEFEVIDKHENEEDDDERIDSLHENSARLIGRRVDVFESKTRTWKRGTILRFDERKDVHIVIHDDIHNEKKEYKLNEVVYRMVEVEEEWVEVGSKAASQCDDSLGNSRESITSDESL